MEEGEVREGGECTSRESLRGAGHAVEDDAVFFEFLADGVRRVEVPRLGGGGARPEGGGMGAETTRGVRGSGGLTSDQDVSPPSIPRP